MGACSSRLSPPSAKTPSAKTPSAKTPSAKTPSARVPYRKSPYPTTFYTEESVSEVAPKPIVLGSSLGVFSEEDTANIRSCDIPIVPHTILEFLREVNNS